MSLKKEDVFEWISVQLKKVYNGTQSKLIKERLKHFVNSEDQDSKLFYSIYRFTSTSLKLDTDVLNINNLFSLVSNVIERAESSKSVFSFLDNITGDYKVLVCYTIETDPNENKVIVLDGLAVEVTRQTTQKYLDQNRIDIVDNFFDVISEQYDINRKETDKSNHEKIELSVVFTDLESEFYEYISFDDYYEEEGNRLLDYDNEVEYNVRMLESDPSKEETTPNPSPNQNKNKKKSKKDKKLKQQQKKDKKLEEQLKEQLEEQKLEKQKLEEQKLEEQEKNEKLKEIEETQQRERQIQHDEDLAKEIQEYEEKTSQNTAENLLNFLGNDASEESENEQSTSKVIESILGNEPETDDREKEDEKQKLNSSDIMDLSVKVKDIYDKSFEIITITFSEETFFFKVLKDSYVFKKLKNGDESSIQELINMSQNDPEMFARKCTSV